MRYCISPRLLGNPFLFAMLFLIFGSPFVSACDAVGVGPWDWTRCWSMTRIVLWLGALVAAWYFAMEVVFPLLLDYSPGNSPWFGSIVGLVLTLFLVGLLASLVFTYFGLTYGWSYVTHLSADGRPVTYLVWHERVEWASLVMLIWFMGLALWLPVFFIAMSNTCALPRACFAWSLGIFAFLMIASFDFCFGAMGTELRFRTHQIFPAQWVWLNIHFQWVGLLALGILFSGLVYFVLRGPKETAMV